MSLPRAERYSVAAGLHAVVSRLAVLVIAHGLLVHLAHVGHSGQMTRHAAHRDAIDRAVVHFLPS